MTNEEYEQGWAKLQLMLSHPKESLDDDGYDLAQVAALSDFLSEKQKNFLAERLVQSLQEGLSSGEPLRTIDTSLLGLADNYLAGTRSATKAIELLQSAFQPENWDKRSFDDLHAIAFGLLDLEFKGTIELWKGFYEHFKDDVENKYDAFDVYLTGTINCGLDEYFAAINSQEPAEWLEDRISIHSLLLKKLYSPELVKAKIEGYINRDPATAATNPLRPLLGLLTKPAPAKVLITSEISN